MSRLVEEVDAFHILKSEAKDCIARGESQA